MNRTRLDRNRPSSGIDAKSWREMRKNGGWVSMVCITGNLFAVKRDMTPSYIFVVVNSLWQNPERICFAVKSSGQLEAFGSKNQRDFAQG